MADITATNLVTAESDTDSTTTYTTGTVTYGANELVLAWVSVRAASAITISGVTLSGASGTWTEIDSQATGAGGTGQLKAFRCLNGTGGSGAVTISVASAGVTITGCHWSFVKVTGVDTSGTNGSGAVVQSVKANDATNDATFDGLALATFTSSRNRGVGGFAVHLTVDVTAGGGWTEIAQTTGASAPAHTLETAFGALNDPSPSWTWTGNNTTKCAILVELKVLPITGTASVDGAGAFAATGLRTGLATASIAGAGAVAPTGRVYPQSGYPAVVQADFPDGYWRLGEDGENISINGVGWDAT